MGEVKAEEFQRQANVASLSSLGKISEFLRATALPSGAAPLYVAGFAQREAGAWRLYGGEAGGAGLHTPFDLASVTKPVFATLVAHLVSAHRLSWETKLQEVFHEVTGTWAGGQTIEALLSHRSGLVPHVELFRSSWSGAPIQLGELWQQAAGARQSASSDQAVYCDLGYILVGFAVERITGCDLDQLLASVICEPWGLAIGSARTFAASDPQFFRVVAPTENQVPRGGVLRGIVHDDNAWALRGTSCCGHAGLFGTLQGVLRFGVGILEGLGKSASPGRRAVFEPMLRRRAGGTLRMGFDGISGPESMAGRNAGAETFGHLGFTGTSLWCDPERERVTVLLSNRVHPSRNNPRIRALRPKIHDFLWLC